MEASRVKRARPGRLERVEVESGNQVVVVPPAVSSVFRRLIWERTEERIPDWRVSDESL